MATFIVCTNFSETSRNALAYACSLAKSKAAKDEISIILLNVYSIPANYSGDGIALVTINNALDSAEEELHEELEWVHEEFGELNVIGKVTTGRLLVGLKNEIDEMQASLVILGTGGNYGELWSWDADILNAVRDLPVPVLTIPPNVIFKPLQNVAFACNLKNINNKTPFETLLKLVAFTEAKLHVVYVTSHEFVAGSAEAKNQLIVGDNLKNIDPIYHTILENQVVQAIGRFVEENDIQLLLVIPKRHGLWENLFHKSFTKELSRLNRLPIMALH